MSDSQIKFSFSLDQHSFQQVKSSLAMLTAEMTKFANATRSTGGFFGGANIGRPPTSAQGLVQAAGRPGANSPQGSMTKIVLENADAFRKMANLGSSSLKGLTDALKTSVRDQNREINALKTNLDELAKRYQKVKNIPGAQREGYQMAMMSQRGQVIERQDEIRSMQQMGHQAGGFKNWMYQAGGGGVGGSYFGGNVQGGVGGMAGAAGIAGLIAGGVVAGVKTAMAGSRMFGDVEQTRSSLVGSDIRRIRSGDVTGMLARQMMIQDSGRRGDLLKQTGGLAGFDAAGGAFKSLIGDRDPHGALSHFADLQASQYANHQRMVQQYEQSEEFRPYKQAMESFSGSLGSRISAGRVLGLRSSLRNGFGGTSVSAVDPYSSAAAKETREGYSIEARAAAFQQSMQLGMGGNFTGDIKAAGAMGWGQWGNVLAGAGMGGSYGMARAALGATPNVAAGMGIGGMLGFNPAGTTSGVGLMNAIQGGFNFGGGIQDMATVQRIQAGLGTGNAMSRGFDGYQQGRNLVSAIGQMPGGTTYAQDYLANGMDFKQLLDASSGNLTKTARALGVTQKNARGQLGGIASSVFERFVDQGGGDPLSRAIRGLRSSGGDITGFLKSATGEQKNALGAYLGIATGTGEEGGEGAIGLLSGVDNRRLRSRGAPAGRLGELEQAALDRQAKTIGEDGNKLKEIMGNIVTSLGEAGSAEVKALSNFATNLNTEAKDLTDALGNIASAINETAQAIRQGRSPNFNSANGKAQSQNTVNKPDNVMGHTGPVPAKNYESGWKKK